MTMKIKPSARQEFKKTLKRDAEFLK